ncbi:MAG: glycosyl hydrolase [Geothrix sp.]|uniref:glycosyl hydrolase n=1 Tax=Geothrix sp. TaxID=1962974 RepID=UPI003BB12F30
MNTVWKSLQVVLLGSLVVLPATAQTVKVGAGAYWLGTQGSDKDVPPAPMRTEALLKTAAQTNQWYSTLIFNRTPEAIFAQPLTFKAVPAGLELSLPVKAVISTERKDTEIHYPHLDPVLLGPADFEPGPARLAKAGDWSIDIDFSRGADRMLATIAHGSPYAYLRVSRGDVKVGLPDVGARLPAGEDPRVLALRVKGKVYAFFGPTGVRWEQTAERQWLARMPAGRDYLAAAALPDDRAETLTLFTRHAYAFVEDTRVSWHCDAASSSVETRFETTARVMEGSETTPLLGLYPHQWYGNASVQGRLGPAYDTLRGRIHLLAATGFKTTLTYPGILPWWPGVKGSPRAADLADVLKSDVRKARPMMLEIGNGPYWQGKGLQRIVQLMNVAEQQGDLEARDGLLKLLKGRVEQWFSGADRKTYFRYSKTLGTLVAYPEEYFSVEQVNDHHFHYGYWIFAMAQIALRDPAWAAKDKWGGMVDKLIADIATPTRGGAEFPFLRNFDPYESHSWASGIGLGPFGNNQESSSEAVNAWAGLILWAEVTGDRALRDLGIWLYASEIKGIQTYWFDLDRQVLPAEYRNIEVSMLFGGKFAHNTWWTDEPRQIKGINLLPLTTASLYLGRDPGFVKRSLAELPAQSAAWATRGRRPDPPDIWQDVFAEYMALADPAAGLAQWNRWGAVEFGNTRSHTLHWLLSLQRLGLPDFTVTSDTTLYSVFKKPDGTRTYLAFNAGASPLTVRFSDGTQLAVPPRSLAETMVTGRPAAP